MNYLTISLTDKLTTNKPTRNIARNLFWLNNYFLKPILKALRSKGTFYPTSMTSMTLMSPFLQSHFSRAYLYMQYKTAPQSNKFKCYETFRLINSRDGAPVVVSGSLFCLCFFDKYRFIFKVVLHLSVSVEYVWTVLHWTFFFNDEEAWETATVVSGWYRSVFC